jgi:hypothetical protein
MDINIYIVNSTISFWTIQIEYYDKMKYKTKLTEWPWTGMNVNVNIRATLEGWW